MLLTHQTIGQARSVSSVSRCDRCTKSTRTITQRLDPRNQRHGCFPPVVDRISLGPFFIALAIHSEHIKYTKAVCIFSPFQSTSSVSHFIFVYCYPDRRPVPRHIHTLLNHWQNSNSFRAPARVSHRHEPTGLRTPFIAFLSLFSLFPFSTLRTSAWTRYTGTQITAIMTACWDFRRMCNRLQNMTGLRRKEKKRTYEIVSPRVRVSLLPAGQS